MRQRNTDRPRGLGFGKTRRKTGARMDGKLCVITGATSGIGLAAARRLAKGGARLVLIARSRGKAEAVQAELAAAYGIQADLVIADFNRLSEVRAAADAIRARYPVIDVLINCAGLFSPHQRMTPDGNEMTFQVNHLASFLLTVRLLGPVTQSPQGRILQVNSVSHRFGGLKLDDLNWQSRAYFWPQAYGASKLAQLMTVHTLSQMLKDTHVTVNAMHPGIVGTNIVQNSGHLLQWLMRRFKRVLLKSPAVAGEAIYTLCAAPELAGVSGQYFTLAAQTQPAAAARQDALCAQVWTISLELTGLHPSSSVPDGPAWYTDTLPAAPCAQ